MHTYVHAMMEPCPETTQPGTSVRALADTDKKRRFRTGCLCCRTRRKKCDERKPVCVGCERNFLVCSWPPYPTSGKGRRGDNPGSISSPTSSESLPESPGESSSLRRLSESAGVPASSSSAIGWPSSIRISATPRNTSILLKQPMQQQLYQHYQSRTAHSVSSCHDHTNPFIKYIMPIAESDDLVLQAVLALSGAQLGNKPFTASEVKITASTHYALALRGLKFRITEYANGQDVIVPLLSATLLMCLVEAIQGSCNENVFHHLKGARSLLLRWVSTPEAQRESNLRAFLVEIYLYTATLTSTPFGQDIQSLVLQDSHILFPLLANGSGAFFGCSHALFELIPQVYALSIANSDMASRVEPYRSQNYANYQYLLGKIVVWQPAPEVDPSFAACGMIYKQALLVFLYTSVGAYYIDAWTLSMLKDQCLDSIQLWMTQLPLNAPISGTLTWPLAIVGSCARMPGHREMIRQRLRGLWELLHISVFEQLLFVLDALWESGLENGDIFLLEGFMKQLNMRLIIS